MPVVEADGQQNHADGHRPGLQPVIPANVFGQADKLVQHVNPPRKKHAAQADRQVVGDPSGRPAFEYQPQPEQEEQGGAAFAGDVQPLPFAEGFGGAKGQVQQQPDIGCKNQQPEFPTMVFENVQPGHQGSAKT